MCVYTKILYSTFYKHLLHIHAHVQLELHYISVPLENVWSMFYPIVMIMTHPVIISHHWSSSLVFKSGFLPAKLD